MQNINEGSEIKAAALIIYKDFNIPFAEEDELSTAMDTLKDILADRIQYLLVNDSDQLFRILYRIDVNSSKIEELLKSEQFLDVPVQIADLVIQRQLNKIRTRARYKNDKGEITE